VTEFLHPADHGRKIRVGIVGQFRGVNAERRYGNFLHTKTRSEYVLSTKVGEASQCVGDGGHVVASNNVADDGCNVAGKSIAASFHPIFINRVGRTIQGDSDGQAMASNTIERSKQEIPMSNYGMET
jgi:hypothetical protein